MGKVWVLDTDTKGTGAQMMPLEKVLEEPAQKAPRGRRSPGREQPGERPRRAPVAKREGKVATRSTPLPPGHVRKRTTGELGKVRSVDAKAGTATVQWLKQGRTSTVPITALSRR